MTKEEIKKKAELLANNILCLKAAEHIDRDDFNFIADEEKSLDTLQMYINKAEFVEKLAEFYTENIPEGLGIYKMEYDIDENYNEKVFVYCDEFSRKWFPVDGDSVSGIFKDFGKFLIEGYYQQSWECVK